MWLLACLALLPDPVRLSQLLQAAVDRGDVAGVVALVADKDRVLYHQAFGKLEANFVRRLTLELPAERGPIAINGRRVIIAVFEDQSHQAVGAAIGLIQVSNSLQMFQGPQACPRPLGRNRHGRMGRR